MMRRAWAMLVVLLLLGAAAPVEAGAARPLQTAITNAGVPADSDMPLAFARMRAAGATAVRLFVGWRDIAPEGASKPAGFDARNPADPLYRWADLDAQVQAAVAQRLNPMISVNTAPAWAQGGTPESPFLDGAVRPSPDEFGAFAEALATRYSGRFGGLPRVRLLQALNEANLSFNLFPSYDTPWSQPVTSASRPVSPDLYVPLVNAFAAAVHRVNPDNVVLAGGLAPFGRFGARDHGVPPLVFMRQMLCLTSRDRPQAGCSRRAEFDVWGQDPYTGGGPQHRARLPGNVSIGNLSQVRRTLTAASRAGKIASNGAIRFWVLEFGWNTNPPFARGVPLRLHARWVAEALYRMWLDGVTLVTWFQLRDDAQYVPGTRYQSGLYFRCGGGLACDRPKPALTAFRFPFVAFRSGQRVRVWGRTPGGRRGVVVIEQRVGRGWRRLARLSADRYGIFTARVTPRGAGVLRSRLGRATSVPFSLRRPPDRIVDPAL